MPTSIKLGTADDGYVQLGDSQHETAEPPPPPPPSGACMMKFVTLAEAKDHLYVDHSADDALIDAYICAASAAVKNYLKSASPFQPALDPHYNPVVDSNGDQVYETDSDGDMVLRLEVQQATLILTGYFYRSRDNDEGNEWERGYLPRPVTALLYPLRDPAWA